MAINRLIASADLPTANIDWTRMKALLSALLLHQEQPLRVVGSNVVKGALFQIGGTAYLAESDTAISGTASNYVKITPSGDGSTCAAAFVSSLTGVAWSSTYNGYYDSGSPASLYIFDEGKAKTAGQIAAIMNTKNEVVPLGMNWLAALALEYTEPTDRNAAIAAAVASGEYAPTVTLFSNANYAEGGNCRYTRINNIVHISGHIYVRPTNTTDMVIVTVSLPIASNLGNYDAEGVLATRHYSYLGAGQIASAAGYDKLDFSFRPLGADIHHITFECTYKII